MIDKNGICKECNKNVYRQALDNPLVIEDKCMCWAKELRIR